MSLKIAVCLILLVFSPYVLAANTNIRLLLVVVIDQMLPERLSKELPGGLGRLVREGRVYDQARLNHAVTNTCPGHAVVLTGKNPASMGIIGNESFDRNTWTVRYCVDDTSAEAKVFGRDIGRSPRLMQATTTGDWLKAADPGAKVISLSLKDRAAITLGGQTADLAIWFDRNTGVMTSSGYYLERSEDLPVWVQQFNGTSPLVDGFLSRLPEAWVHPAGRFREDNFPAEDDEFSRTSPHPLRVGELSDVANQFYASPFADRAVAALAIDALEQEELGRRGHTDLLALGFSASDTVGHLYGPYSAESDDALRVLDEALGDVLKALDKHFAPGEVLAVLTADHGVLPMPEWRQQADGQACPLAPGRAAVMPLVFSLYSRLYWNFTFPFGNPFDLVAIAGSQIYVNDRYARELGHSEEDVVTYVEAYLEALPYIETVWRPNEFLGNDTGYAQLYRNSWLPGMGGDLIVQNARGCLLAGDHGTTHGTPWDYDRRVPLIFYGGGLAPEIVSDDAHTVDIAPTLAPLLGITPPEGLEGRNLLQVLR